MRAAVEPRTEFLSPGSLRTVGRRGGGGPAVLALLLLPQPEYGTQP